MSTTGFWLCGIVIFAAGLFVGAIIENKESGDGTWTGIVLLIIVGLVALGRALA